MKFHKKVNSVIRIIFISDISFLVYSIIIDYDINDTITDNYELSSLNSLSQIKINSLSKMRVIHEYIC